MVLVMQSRQLHQLVPSLGGHEVTAMDRTDSDASVHVRRPSGGQDAANRHFRDEWLVPPGTTYKDGTARPPTPLIRAGDAWQVPSPVHWLATLATPGEAARAGAGRRFVAAWSANATRAELGETVAARHVKTDSPPWCSFVNLCLNASHYLYVVDDTRVTAGKAVVNWVASEPCFRPLRGSNRRALVNRTSVARMAFLPGHTVILNQFTVNDHPTHWANAWAQLVHLLVTPGTFLYGREHLVDRVVHFRAPSPSREYALTHLDLLLAVAGTNKSAFEALYRDAVERYDGVCMEAASATPDFEPRLTANHMDMLRVVAQKHIGVAPLPQPPRRVGWLVRTEGNGLRWPHGWQRAVARVPGGIELFSLNSSMTFAEQGRAFARYGVVIMSHSSQIGSGFMAHPGTSILELNPSATPYTHEFRHWSERARLRHRHVLWHWPCYDSVTSRFRDNLTCTLDRSCIIPWRAVFQDYAVNMTALLPALDDAIRFIGLEPLGSQKDFTADDSPENFYHACYGKPPPARWQLELANNSGSMSSGTLRPP